jgi:hypothetical protein
MVVLNLLFHPGRITQCVKNGVHITGVRHYRWKGKAQSGAASILAY